MIETIFSRSALRIAVIGLGRATINDHLPALAADKERFDIVAACELVKERRDRIAKEFPACRMFRTFSDMLDERDIDVVLIALPAVDRIKYALMSLERGFRTVVESPLALTADDAKILRGASVRASNRLTVVERGVYSPDFALASMVAADSRLGKLLKVIVKREEFVRRCDWQSLHRTGGGAVCCDLPDLVVPALRLIDGRPVQMWSDMKRVVSTGDVEDYVHLDILSSNSVTAEVEYNGAVLDENLSPSYTLVGSRGVFRVMPGERSGTLVHIDPSFKLPRVRTSVRTPPIESRRAKIPAVTETVSLDDDVVCGLGAFWNSVFEAVRRAVPLRHTLDESIEAVRFIQLVRKSSQFGR